MRRAYDEQTAVLRVPSTTPAEHREHEGAAGPHGEASSPRLATIRFPPSHLVRVRARPGLRYDVASDEVVLDRDAARVAVRVSHSGFHGARVALINTGCQASYLDPRALGDLRLPEWDGVPPIPDCQHPVTIWKCARVQLLLAEGEPERFCWEGPLGVTPLGQTTFVLGNSYLAAWDEVRHDRRSGTLLFRRANPATWCWPGR